MSDTATPHTHLLLVLAAHGDDYVAWCKTTGRTSFGSNAWAISAGTGIFVTHHRTFQVTDRWQEDPSNRRTLRGLQADGVPYGDEHGPWPPERVPVLTWPSWWRRMQARLRRGRS